MDNGEWKVDEFVSSLMASESLGPQVVHHRIMQATEARISDPVRPWPRAIQELLRAKGIDGLYEHQARATDIVRSGKNVVVATPTASGKTLCYNLPVLEQILANPDTRAIYLFPLKALARDQLRAFNELSASMLGHTRPTAAVYDGDTPQNERKKLRQSPPNVLMTNPEMVHLSILPYHSSWAGLLAGLTHIVVDEVHTMRGVMGSHMAWVFRRLLRMASYYGARPSFVFSSATIGNPEELCHMLTGREAKSVDKSGAPQGARNYIFLNPLDSPYSAAIKLLKAALARGLRTIVYAQSRRMTELISVWAQDKSGNFKDKISAYRAGFLPEERREIESKMSSGELLAVISTSALELGIDIGGLDVCILVGYPGTVMQTMQRGGRVGRSVRSSAVILVAQEDALDQYFMRHPDEFFTRPAEKSVLNPYNTEIMSRHLMCAAAELSLRQGEDFLRDEQVREQVEKMVRDGDLAQSESGQEYYSHRKRPHRGVDLRGGGATMVIENSATGEIIGSIDQNRACMEAHPGAVYLHRGRTYVIEKMDIGAATILAAPKRVGYYTKVRGSKDTEIMEVYGHKQVMGTSVGFGRLKVTENFTGFERRKTSGNILLGISPLDLPPVVFETQGLWIVIPQDIQKIVEDKYYHFMGSIHALEHAAIGILPLLVMADRNDLGGISTPFHEQVGSSAVFIYDGVSGGAGLTREAFNHPGEILKLTLKAIAECGCELGCPSCVHSPKCGSGNRPMDKAGAEFLLGQLITGPKTELKAPAISAQDMEIKKVETKKEDEPMPEHNGNFAVLDLETMRSAQDVGGWNKANRMGASVVCVYDSVQDKYLDFYEPDIPDLLTYLQKMPLIIGFNIIRFDYKVLSGYTNLNFSTLNTLDLLTHIHERLGYRLKLDNLGQATLGSAKSADGLQALEWYKQGKMELITEYCRKDVEITRDLYLFGKQNKYVLYTNKAKKTVRLPVSW